MNHRAAVVVRHWSAWVLLLAALSVVSFTDAFSPLYWTILVLYVGQLMFNVVTVRRPSWRREDSRTTDGDERG